MSDSVGNSKQWWEQGLDIPKAKTTTDGHMTQTAGVDTTRPSTGSDIGKLYNRMNPPGVMGQAKDLFGN